MFPATPAALTSQPAAKQAGAPDKRSLSGIGAPNKNAALRRRALRTTKTTIFFQYSTFRAKTGHFPQRYISLQLINLAENRPISPLDKIFRRSCTRVSHVPFRLVHGPHEGL